MTIKMAVAYLNGEWMAPEDAKVSVFDRGFMFGDSIYEVMAVYDGRVFAIEEHLIRMNKSLDAISLDSPYSDEEWLLILNEAVIRADETPAYLYLQITRGVGFPRSDIYPKLVKPTVLITVTHAPILERDKITPYRMVTKDDFRWARGDIKVTSLMANGLIKNEAIKEGYDDALLFRNGELTESTSSNVFVVKDEKVKTPPKSNFLLHGITRDFLLRVLFVNDIPFEEGKVFKEEILTADEIWVTSTGREVWPVVEVNGVLIGKENPGVLWKKVNAFFQEFKQKL